MLTVCFLNDMCGAAISSLTHQRKTVLFGLAVVFITPCLFLREPLGFTALCGVSGLLFFSKSSHFRNPHTFFMAMARFLNRSTESRHEF